MDQIPLVTSSNCISVDSFWNSVLIYHDRPNVVNRKLAATSTLLLCKISLKCSHIKYIYEIFTREAILYEVRKLKNLKHLGPEFLRSIVETYDKNAVIEETHWDDLKHGVADIFISVRILFPRGQQSKCLELAIFDTEKRIVTFFSAQEHNQSLAPPFPYHFELTQTNKVRLLVNSFEDADTASAEWLADKLFPKFIKWAESGVEDGKSLRSLSLIQPDIYCTLYSELKMKYGDNLVKQWPQKAKTDPQKYVYEDIAIATYLLCLWQKIGAKDVYFVDCGCGNGLLVYILNKEGYTGCGYDIRQRQIWDLFSHEADLRIDTITPKSIFPEATWIIGNHSDELTPWIPIIALNSSPKTNYFVLPCCPYDFSGRKYARYNTKVSQYEDYLNYIKKISVLCGFTTQIDKLRIPSTKRTCLVGVRDTNEISLLTKEEVSRFVAERLNVAFHPRNPLEAVRNCTRLDQNLIKRIIDLVVKELLVTQCPIIKTFNGKSWNKGGTTDLKSLSDKISTNDKMQLKKECGGLQTLLKNHKYIFHVQNGNVSLQEPRSFQEYNKYKTKPCWFLENHPDGCFYEADNCAYKH